MWIRCQERTTLVNVSGIYAEHDGRMCGYINDAYNIQSWTLGKYDTRERTIEILDEIEGHIKANMRYQMPEK